MNKLGRTTIFTLCAVSVAAKVTASSAVAVALNKNGGLGYGYTHNGGITEAEAKTQAIQECLKWGGRNPKIIASTSMPGYGAVVEFRSAGGRTNYAAPLAVPEQQLAIDDALRQAKASAGRNANVVATWRDGSFAASAKAVAIYAPKPEYPAEARAKH